MAPRITSYWDTYGCSKCDNYDLFVLTSNNGGTKADFATWFVPHTKGAPTVYKEDGGEEFDTQLANNGYALPEYLISPDRSFIRVEDDPEPGSNFFTSRGIKEHECGGSVSNSKSANKTCNMKKKSLIRELVNGNLNINISKEDNYTITLYTANGRAIPLIADLYLDAGTHGIKIDYVSIASGMYCAESRTSTKVYRQLITVK